MAWLGLRVVWAWGKARRVSGRLAMLAALAPLPAEAGSFLRAPGSREIILGVTASSFSQAHDHRGRLQRAATFDKADLTVHAEAGWRHDLTLVAVIHNDQLRPRVLNTPGAFATWGAMVGGRLPLWRGQNGEIVSLQALAGVGQAQGQTGFEGELRVGYGTPWSVGAQAGFFDVQIAHRFRPSLAGSEWRLDATAGWQVAPRWLLMAQAFAAASSQGSMRGRHWRIKAQLAAVWHVTPAWSVQASLFRTVAGHRTPADWGGGMAVWRRF